jgi:hypothetical protein
MSYTGSNTAASMIHPFGEMTQNTVTNPYDEDKINKLNAYFWESSPHKDKFLVYPVMPWGVLEKLLLESDLTKVRDRYDFAKIYSSEPPNFSDWERCDNLIFPIVVAQYQYQNQLYNHYALIFLQKVPLSNSIYVFWSSKNGHFI